MREIISINRKWAFTKDFDTVPEEMPKKWCFVNLPHTWNNIDGQDGGNDYYRGKCCYVKNLEDTELPENKKYFLEINGANSSADVYVGGVHIAHHDGGYSRWRCDITQALKKSKILAVTVDNSENDNVYPQMADFTFYGGLYRDVNIIAVEQSHFELEYYGTPGIAVTAVPDGKSADTQIEVYLSNAKENQALHYTILNDEGKTVCDKEVPAVQTKISFTIENVNLWQGKENPYLYTAVAELKEDGRVIDKVSARFGCRDFKIDPNKGFILNSKEYPLRGVSRHQDYKDIGNALTKEHHDKDMELICELGATSVRLAHYQHDRYFYDLCDEKGIVVWAEIPYISKHLPQGRENTVSQMKELIIQNYNHPSIVVWGLSNEITIGGCDDDLIENHRLLNDIAHATDKTRLTAAAVVSMCDIHSNYIQIPDVIAYNHYFGWYGGDVSMNGEWLDNFHREFPRIPIGLSEYGCEALNWHSSNPVQGDYTEEYQSYYHEELIKQLFSRKYLWATYVWNMFDFGADARNEGGENGQNHKGLVTFDRKYKKDSFYAYKAWLSKEPFVHICSKRYIERAEDVTEIKVYSNLPEIELFVNGESMGKQKSENHFFSFKVPNTGESKIVASSGEYSDKSRIKKVSTFNEKYRMKEQGAIINWFDVSEKDGCFSINDTLGDISSVPEGRALIEGLMKNIQSTDNAAGFEINEQMIKMMNSFTVARLANLMKSADAQITKEQLIELNNALNKIKKPE
ncbi:MAG: glycoside hydrolase family 2 TIM barrel-domain containing protein [Eubacterium sp.]